jgi:hypothetical protein
VLFQVSYTDDAGAKTNQSFTTLSMAAAGNITNLMKVFYLASGDITWSTANYAAGTYSLRVRCTFMGA